MSINLGLLYRDIVSSLSAPEGRIRSLDVSNLINQAISDLRIQYIKNGLGNEFTYTETVWVTIDDFDFPYLYYGNLDKNLLRSLPIQWTVRNSVVWKSEDELEDTTQTWSKGDIVIKDRKAYEAVADISSSNTYDLTFEVDNPREYAEGLKFFTGDIVKEDGKWWRATQDYTNDQSQTISASGAFEQVYWKLIGQAYHEATYVPFQRLHEAKLSDNIWEHYPISIREDRLYCTEPNVPITVSYIPEWEYLEDFDADLDIPDAMVNTVKINVVQQLANKLGVKSQLEQIQSSDEEED